MRLTINGRRVESLGDKGSTHLFRAQTTQNKRLIVDLLMSDRELGEQEIFHLTADGHTMPQHPIRVSGGGQRMSWVLADGLRKIGINELLISGPDKNAPWAIVELEILMVKEGSREEPLRTGILEGALAFIIAGAVIIVVAFVWMFIN
ncbi:MAG: hypothetical protein AAB337_00770 [Patescibacteria group bacterium]